MIRQLVAIGLAAFFMVYVYYELAYGGGDPNHKDHNLPRWW